MNRSLMFVTDVPSPYRIHLFNVLNRQLATVGVSFEVLFMAKTAPIRFWSFDEKRCAFRYRIVAGVHPRYKNDLFHFNPGILWHALKTRPTWLVIGGAWNMPTVMGLVFLRVLRGVRSALLWSEANSSSMHFRSGLIARIRSAVTRNVDAFVIPGRVAEETIKSYWQVSGKPFISLPNIVDERLFRDRVLALRACRAKLRAQRQLSDNETVLLWPARLHEQTKGIINFLAAVRNALPRNMTILVVGEGSDRPVIEEWLANSGLKRVFLLGQQSEESMLELYALADVLLLPSLRDPNPLSVVEGLWAGLPLLISRDCGNSPEAVEEGANGWLVDPASEQSMRRAVADMLTKSPCELKEFGRRSIGIAEEVFSTERCTQRFILELLSLHSITRVEQVSA